MKKLKNMQKQTDIKKSNNAETPAGVLDRVATFRLMRQANKTNGGKNYVENIFFELR